MIMKKAVFAVLLLTAINVAYAQDSMEKIMESRAREMFRVIGLDSPDQWKKFIKENYTKALIDKPMTAKVQGGDGGSATESKSNTTEGNIEGKVQMYKMFHNDFGSGKISSLKVIGEKVDMLVESGDMKGTITLKFSKEKPYLIDGLGIQVGN